MAASRRASPLAWPCPCPREFGAGGVQLGLAVPIFRDLGPDWLFLGRLVLTGEDSVPAGQHLLMAPAVRRLGRHRPSPEEKALEAIQRAHWRVRAAGTQPLAVLGARSEARTPGLAAPCGWAASCPGPGRRCPCRFLSGGCERPWLWLHHPQASARSPLLRPLRSVLGSLLWGRSPWASLHRTLAFRPPDRAGTVPSTPQPAASASPAHARPWSLVWGAAGGQLWGCYSADPRWLLGVPVWNVARAPRAADGRRCVPHRASEWPENPGRHITAHPRLRPHPPESRDSGSPRAKELVHVGHGHRVRTHRNSENC